MFLMLFFFSYQLLWVSDVPTGLHLHSFIWMSGAASWLLIKPSWEKKRSKPGAAVTVSSGGMQHLGRGGGWWGWSHKHSGTDGVKRPGEGRGSVTVPQRKHDGPRSMHRISAPSLSKHGLRDGVKGRCPRRWQGRLTLPLFLFAATSIPSSDPKSSFLWDCGREKKGDLCFLSVSAFGFIRWRSAVSWSCVTSPLSSLPEVHRRSYVMATADACFFGARANSVDGREHACAHTEEHADLFFFFLFCCCCFVKWDVHIFHRSDSILLSCNKLDIHFVMLALRFLHGGAESAPTDWYRLKQQKPGLCFGLRNVLCTHFKNDCEPSEWGRMWDRRGQPSSTSLL